jgi:hypothetical protein
MSPGHVKTLHQFGSFGAVKTRTAQLAKQCDTRGNDFAMHHRRSRESMAMDGVLLCRMYTHESG